MKIPRSIMQSGLPISGEKMQLQKEPQTWISLAEAAGLLKVKLSTVISRIENGTLEGKQSADVPFTADGKPNYLVLLECLPIKAQYAYMTNHLKENTFISVDLASPRSTFGDIWVNQFVNIAQMIRDAESIRRNYHGTNEVTKRLRELAASYDLSLSALYRFTAQPSAKKISLLYTDPIYLQNHLPSTMCLWSCDLAYALYLDKDKHYSQNAILKELKDQRDSAVCTSCPYHRNADRSDNNQDIPICVKGSRTMVVPNNRRTLNRLLAHLPPELLLYCRKGYREWRAKYGLFSMREKPILINDCFQGDHHILNLFTRVKIYTTKNDKKYEKVIAVRPVLTAWMDTASGYITGWVISVLPNSDTIAEAFSRACVPTVGDIAKGLPKSILVDCGRDYKSKLLEDPCSSYSAENWSESYLNRRFSGLGILRALNCEIYHCLPYHPQSKNIERLFGTLESNYISKLPGWCYSSAAERPPDFAKHLKKLLNNGELLWLDEFVQLFESEILPAYHGKPDNPKDTPEVTEWQLSYESMSPAQRYQSMEKARTAIPDWKTMSILKRHLYPDQAKVGTYGIRFQNVFYKDEALAPLRGKWVSILCHAFTPPYAPSSITVIYNNEAICEAYPVRKNAFTEESAIVLTEEANLQNAPAKNMKKAVTRISRMAHSILPDNFTPSTLSQKEQLREETYGQTPLNDDIEKDDDTGVSISSVINSEAESASAFISAQKDYDKAYSILFGSME